MAGKKNNKKKLRRLARTVSRWTEVKDQVRVSQILTKAITNFEKKLKAEDFKASVGDFIKLMELEKELTPDSAKEIKVTWVEPTALSEK